MGEEIREPGGPIRPPRWAEALLHIFLKPDEAETESGDLLEAYRDSIQPSRGSFRADLWFLGQVAGYILRASTMSLRNWLLAGLTLCIFMIVYSVLNYPDPHAGSGRPGILIAIFAGILFYGYVAIWRTRPATIQDVSVLRLGAIWGIAIGGIWIGSLIFENLVVPHGFGAKIGYRLALVGFSLPFVSGIHGAMKTGRVIGGMRVGFWGGLISGLIAFLALAVIGYVLAFVPDFPGAEIPSLDHAYTALEFQRLNIFDALGGALAHLFLIGGVFGVIGGTVGGCVGRLMIRIGRGSSVSART
jgi:hypothetical protein